MAWRLLPVGAIFGLLAAGIAIGQVPQSTAQSKPATAASGSIQDQAPQNPSSVSAGKAAPDIAPPNIDQRNSESELRKDHHGRSHDETGGDKPKRDRRFLMERFLMDSVRREGGALELFPLLRVPEVRRELSLDESAFTEKLNNYWLDAQSRAEEGRKQVDDKPREEIANFWATQLRGENQRFRTFLSELSLEQQDRLIGLFVQARNYRAVSNQLVASKLGMDEEQATKLRKDVESIREDTMRETRDRFRRIFENGGDRDQFEKLIRENNQKIDARIEKALSESQRSRLLSLKGVELPGPPEWLVRAVEFGRPGLPRAPGAGAHPGSSNTPADGASPRK